MIIKILMNIILKSKEICLFENYKFIDYDKHYKIKILMFIIM